MDNKNITTRLSRDTSYNRPKKTYQQKLSPEEIKEKLLEYQQVDDITKVPLNTHVRYFSFNSKTGEKQFRLGGFLTRKEPDDPYVILSNGKSSWSVQKNSSIFFKKMSIKDLRLEYEDTIKKLTKDNKKLKKENKMLKETLDQVEYNIKKEKKKKKKGSKKGSKTNK
tara:strand:+ start:780 stop:1280 length:501 start_codon:yes stop_codon:yes gene_type:complete